LEKGNAKGELKSKGLLAGGLWKRRGKQNRPNESGCVDDQRDTQPSQKIKPPKTWLAE